MNFIRKVKLQNFKRFQELELELDQNLNILIGDNEAGKSSVLQAIHLTLLGSRSPIDAVGLDSLMNVQVTRDFENGGTHTFDSLPTMFVELYFNETGDFNLNGNNNSDGVQCDGLRLTCTPDPDFSSTINEILGQDEVHIPFEFYSVKFTKFDGNAYSPYKKFLRHLLIDSSQTSDDYALRGYVKSMYSGTVEAGEKNKHMHEYRKRKNVFQTEVLLGLNERIEGDYKFSIRNNSKANLETDLTLSEHDVALEEKGRGKQSMIKTEFALARASGELDVLLLEEPENHLSHTSMNKLIAALRGSSNKQLILTTHNSLISARLDLRHTILFNSGGSHPVPMNAVPERIAKFFMKAPDSNVLEFVLSEKVILVEGNAEYMMMKTFFENLVGASIEQSGIHVISVGGLSFSQYMTIAKELTIKTAIIRDNDGDYQKNCVERYEGLVDDGIRVFGDEDNTRNTLEVCVYQDNTATCDTLFSTRTRTLTVQDYMLSNKSESAFRLVDEKGGDLVAPSYIQEAISWINE